MVGFKWLTFVLVGERWCGGVVVVGREDVRVMVWSALVAVYGMVCYGVSCVVAGGGGGRRGGG